MSDEEEAVTLAFEENVRRLGRLLDTLMGKDNPEGRFAFMFNPKERRSTSNLSVSQAEFIEDAKMLVPIFPQFEALDKLADEILITSPSVKNQRMEDAIQFQRASRGMEGTQVGIFQGIKKKVTGKKEKDNEQ